MRKIWKVKELSERARILGKKMGLDSIIAQLLINRRIDEDDFNSFLYPQQMPVPSWKLLPDIGIAIDRIRRAVKNKENIFLYGDYDVDGLSSLVIFHDYIKNTGVPFSFYIPHRMKEGFGLNKQAVRKIKNRGASLIICFDCGTNSYEEISLAKSLGMDVIVVDHHQPEQGRNIPGAFVNPKRPDSKYPFSNLSGATVAFKLVQALKDDSCPHLLDLVALSVVCDVVPLQGENRMLLEKGLQSLRKTKRTAVNALCEASGVNRGNIDSFHLGYILGPKINASGRIGTAHDALNMFITEDESMVHDYARKLVEYNRRRREIEKVVLKEAQEALGEASGGLVLVVHKEGWHHGVLGIVASRLVDRYYRPAIVIGFDQGSGKGSARSIDNFNMIHALGCCEDYLLSYGGHKKAAGIEILYKDLDNFKNRLNETAQKMLKPSDLLPVIKIDLEIKFCDITGELMEGLERLKPFGEGNAVPMFLTRGARLRQPPRKIANGQYSLWLNEGEFTYEGVFPWRNNLSDIFNYGDKFDIVYSLGKNNYHQDIRLSIKDVRLHKLI